MPGTCTLAVCSWHAWLILCLSLSRLYLPGKQNFWMALLTPVPRKKNTVKFLNFRTTENFAVIYLKLKLRGQTLRYFFQKDTIGIANSEDPDQTAPRGAV